MMPSRSSCDRKRARCTGGRKTTRCAPACQCTLHTHFSQHGLTSHQTPDESRTVSVAGVAHEAHGTTNVPDANPREEAEDSMQKFLLEKKLQWLRPFFRQVSQSIRTYVCGYVVKMCWYPPPLKLKKSIREFSRLILAAIMSLPFHYLSALDLVPAFNLIGFSNDLNLWLQAQCQQATPDSGARKLLASPRQGIIPHHS